MATRRRRKRSRGRTARRLLAAAALVGAGIAAGVAIGHLTGGSDSQTLPQTPPVAPAKTPAPAKPAPAPKQPQAETRKPVIVFFVRDGKVAPVARLANPSAAVGAAALRALLAGPTEAERAAGLTTAIPPGTQPTRLAITEGGAEATFTADLKQNSLAEAQVVQTLAQFPTVRAGTVSIGYGSGGTVVTHSAGGPPAYEAQTPAILVESPLPGETVASPLRVSGTANVFEATFVVDVQDASGKTIAHQVVTATSGTGTRGTFATTIALAGAAAGPITLVAYDQSAEDGRPIDVVRVPLTLR